MQTFWRKSRAVTYAISCLFTHRSLTHGKYLLRGCMAILASYDTLGVQTSYDYMVVSNVAKAILAHGYNIIAPRSLTATENYQEQVNANSKEAARIAFKADDYPQLKKNPLPSG